MDISQGPDGERTWCDDCTAVRVYPQNVPACQTFLECLPAWRTGGTDRLYEGFDRKEVEAVLSLRNDPDPQSTWEGLLVLEAEWARVRALERKESQSRQPVGRNHAR